MLSTLPQSLPFRVPGRRRTGELRATEIAARTLQSLQTLLADEARWRPALVAGRGGSRKP
jgi:hypothetical protein